jgi:hypothetical protein
MPVPVWLRDLDWVSNSKLVSVTEHKEVRLYDTKVRRPIQRIVVGENPLRKLAVINEQ